MSTLLITTILDSWKGQIHLYCWLFPYGVPGLNSACSWACCCNQQGNDKNDSTLIWIWVSSGSFCKHNQPGSSFWLSWTCRFSRWISLHHSSVNFSRMLKRKPYCEFNLPYFYAVALSSYLHNLKFTIHLYINNAGLWIMFLEMKLKQERSQRFMVGR